MKAYLLDNGYMSCDSGYVVAMQEKVSTDNDHIVRKWRRLPVYCVLLETEKGKYIYDMGMDRDINQMFANMGSTHHKTFPYTFTEEQLLENQLRLCNTEINEIQGIVLSHMHYDHIGNLPLFRSIPVYVHKDEYENASTLGIKSYYFDKYIKDVSVEFIPVNSSFFLSEHVEIIPFGSSHCPGLLGMILHLNEGNFLFPSDIFYTKDNYGPPVQQIGKPYDTLGTLKVAEEIYNLVEKYQAKVMFSHDWDEFQKYRKAPDYYQ